MQKNNISKKISTIRRWLSVQPGNRGRSGGFFVNWIFSVLQFFSFLRGLFSCNMQHLCRRTPTVPPHTCDNGRFLSSYYIPFGPMLCVRSTGAYMDSMCSILEHPIDTIRTTLTLGWEFILRFGNMASFSCSLDNPICPTGKKSDTLLMFQINIYYHPSDNATPCQKPESQKRSVQWQVDRQSWGIWPETPECNVWSINFNDRAFKSIFVSNIVIMGDFICGETSCSFYRDIDISMIVPACLLRKIIFYSFHSFH